MPAFPSLPLFRAVDVMEEGRTAKLDWSSIDLITDRNNLRKLLGWAYPIPGVKNKPTFRIDMELVGEKTLILHRWEERSSVNSEGTGFGDSFERESTTPGPGCEQSTLAGHGRIITYDFSGLKLLVRFEVDACFESDTAVPFTDDQTSSEPMDALTETLGSLDISSDTALRVMRGGVIVPQSDLIKIKTRSSPVDTQALDIQIQLLLGQIPRAYIGMHSQGVFGSVHEELSWPESETARHKVQVGLKKLRRVLQEIIDFALASSKNAKLSLVYKDKVLQVYQRTSDASLLPEDVLIRFQE
ncbi:hypothetical protein EW026_g4912 [Hermanssonia centrifuga]|uniref:Uncharacterized protein n=1 Tax=Hermanssonia centrifuga TaxID=98765 RepID=A0A4S4KGN9_9APHY|nr:hypothetical protein EW026_g4912 [Hermanssonia centrifuga]